MARMPRALHAPLIFALLPTDTRATAPTHAHPWPHSSPWSLVGQQGAAQHRDGGASRKRRKKVLPACVGIFFVAAVLASDTWCDNRAWTGAPLRVSSLTIDGNRAANNHTVGLMLRSWQSVVEDVHVVDAASDGIRITNLNTQLSHEGMKTTLDDHFVKNVGDVLGTQLVEDPIRTGTVWFKSADAAAPAMQENGGVFQGMNKDISDDGECLTEDEFLAAHPEGYPCAPGPFYQAAAPIPKPTPGNCNVTARDAPECCPSGGFLPQNRTSYIFGINYFNIFTFSFVFLRWQPGMEAEFLRSWLKLQDQKDFLDLPSKVSFESRH